MTGSKTNTDAETTTPQVRDSGDESEDESEVLEESPCGRWQKRREEVWRWDDPCQFCLAAVSTRSLFSDCILRRVSLSLCLYPAIGIRLNFCLTTISDIPRFTSRVSNLQLHDVLMIVKIK